jgi:putative flippase GtrA
MSESLFRRGSVRRHSTSVRRIEADGSIVVGDIYRETKVLLRQFFSFVGVGLLAMVAHYGCLIGLVEAGILAAVPATLIGYIAGGLVSYGLNRSHTFASGRPHQEALWRFAAVAGIGFCLTYVSMHIFVDRMAFPYLPAQVLATGLVMFWSFTAHKLWTFGLKAYPDTAETPDR